MGNVYMCACAYACGDIERGMGWMEIPVSIYDVSRTHVCIYHLVVL